MMRVYAFVRNDDLPYLKTDQAVASGVVRQVSGYPNPSCICWYSNSDALYISEVNEYFELRETGFSPFTLSYKDLTEKCRSAGKTLNWKRMMKRLTDYLMKGDILFLDSVTDLGNEETFAEVYCMFLRRGIHLSFLQDPAMNSDVFESLIRSADEQVMKEILHRQYCQIISTGHRRIELMKARERLRAAEMADGEPYVSGTKHLYLYLAEHLHANCRGYLGNDGMKRLIRDLLGDTYLVPDSTFRSYVNEASGRCTDGMKSDPEKWLALLYDRR